jgi:hypothetical protein
MRANGERDWIDVVFDPIRDRFITMGVNLMCAFAVFWLVVLVVEAVVYIYQYAWYAVQFLGIEGPGFAIACAILVVLPWVRKQLRKDR